MIKKLLLFPYHPDVELLAEKASELKDVFLTGVYSFKEDSLAVKGINEKLGATDDFEEMLNRCDSVLLLNNYRECKKEKYYEVIQAALDAGKQVVITPMAKTELDLETYEGKYTVLENIPAHASPEGEMGNMRYTIETPIITIFGMGKNCNKFENQILLYSVLEEEGYHPLWISSNPLGALFGGYTTPDFLYDTTLGFEEKIFRFNRFVYQLSIMEKPDVFVIGIPEGISEFSAHEYNHFAEYPLVIGSAVPVDSSIMCTYFIPELDVEGVENLLHHCRERFGFPVHMVSLGRTAFERMEGEQQVTYLFLGKEYLEKHHVSVKNQSDTYVGVWESEKIKKSMQKLLDRLAGNPDAI